MSWLDTWLSFKHFHISQYIAKNCWVFKYLKPTMFRPTPLQELRSAYDHWLLQGQFCVSRLLTPVRGLITAGSMITARHYTLKIEQFWVKTRKHEPWCQKLISLMRGVPGRGGAKMPFTCEDWRLSCGDMRWYFGLLTRINRVQAL